MVILINYFFNGAISERGGRCGGEKEKKQD
jgi:hypothetical protein